MFPVKRGSLVDQSETNQNRHTEPTIRYPHVSS